MASVATAETVPLTLVRMDHDEAVPGPILVHQVDEAGQGRPLLQLHGDVNSAIKSRGVVSVLPPHRSGHPAKGGQVSKDGLHGQVLRHPREPHLDEGIQGGPTMHQGAAHLCPGHSCSKLVQGHPVGSLRGEVNPQQLGAGDSIHSGHRRRRHRQIPEDKTVPLILVNIRLHRLQIYKNSEGVQLAHVQGRRSRRLL